MIRILIADDDFIIREGLKMLLESQPDFTLVDTAENGREAVTKCRGQEVDVVLLDIRMPEMNGIEAAEFMLQEKLARPLLLTTFDEEEFIIKALKLGVGGYILKNSPPSEFSMPSAQSAQGGMSFRRMSCSISAVVSAAGKSRSLLSFPSASRRSSS